MKIDSKDKEIINECFNSINFIDKNTFEIKIKGNFPENYLIKIKNMVIKRLLYYMPNKNYKGDNIFLNNGENVTFIFTFKKLDLDKVKNTIKFKHKEFIKNEKELNKLINCEVEYYDSNTNTIQCDIIMGFGGHNNVVLLKNEKKVEISLVNLNKDEKWYNKINEIIDKKVYYDGEWISRDYYEMIVGKIKREEVINKNLNLIQQLSKKRENMCGLGTRKVKLFLNKQIKNNDINAELYRVALEVEDYNIQAKECRGKFRDKKYNVKHKKIIELIDLCEKYGVKYGIEVKREHLTNVIFYFELPKMRQISFHTSLYNNDFDKYPKYDKEWDGEVNSTLNKIEETLNNVYFK